MGAKRNEPVGQWISQLAYAGSFLFGSFPAHKYHTQPHPPFQHHQGSSTAVDYSSHFFFSDFLDGGNPTACIAIGQHLVHAAPRTIPSHN